MRSPTRLPSLTRRAVDTLATWAWLEATAIGRVAFALAAHPEGGAEAESFAAALGLVEPAQRMPYVGDRISVSGPRARLRLDGCSFRVDMAVGPQWAGFVGDGGPVALIVGLDPLPCRSTPDAVEEYLGRGRLRMGTTGTERTARRRSP